MSLSNFNTPSPIAVALDLYVADVRFAVSDRTDTIVEVRPATRTRPPTSRPPRTPASSTTMPPGR